MESMDSATIGTVPSQINIESFYKDGVKYANQRILPPSNPASPYFLPFANIDDPRPIDQLIYRFTIWKMIIKQIVFYFKEMSIFKKQTFLANRAMIETLEVLNKQNSGKLKNKVQASKGLKKSISSFDDVETNSQFNDQTIVNKLLQSTFLPSGDHSILSISNTFFESHNCLKEKELITFQQLTNKLIPKLENLKDQLNNVIEQISSLKSNQGFKTKNLKVEIAKTGGILSDYLNNIELFKNGETKTRLGTTIKLSDIKTPKDPYLLKLKLDLQLKDQIYTEAKLKDMYYDLQKKAVQLEKILYEEIQSCIGTYTDLIDNELNSVKDNLVQPFRDGFLKNSSTMDWDFFIRNDRNKNFLPLTGDEIFKPKQIRKTSDVVYPFRKSSISSCLLSNFLEKKSKYLKNYSKFFYVLTLNYLHEFKSNDRLNEITPLNSFPIDAIKIAIVEGEPRKFVLRISKMDGEESRVKLTFKCANEDMCKKWVEYLGDITDFDSPIERNNSYEGDDDLEDSSDDQRSVHSEVQGGDRSIFSVPSVVSTAKVPSDHSLDNYFSKMPSSTGIQFKSVKQGGGRISRGSSRTSSRASSPTRSTVPAVASAASAARGTLSPRITPMSPSTISPQLTGGQDYFSFRRGNRLPSSGSLSTTGKLTPTSASNNASAIPTIIHPESEDGDNSDLPGVNDQSSGGMERRRKTLTEQLKMGNASGSLLQLPQQGRAGMAMDAGLIPTPGVIPGSRLNGMFNMELGGPSATGKGPASHHGPVSTKTPPISGAQKQG